MRLVVLGSADAFNAEGRLHASYLLEGPPRVVVDFGGTGLAALRQAGFKSSDVDVFAFTHLHGDHVGGTPFLLIDAMFADRQPRLRMVGPFGLEARVRRLLEVTYGTDITERPELPELAVTELLPGEALELGGLLLETFPADHQDPPERPLCLRFTGQSGATVAFSGDTRLSEGLLAAAAGVDVLVAECSALAPPAGRHTTWQEWRAAWPTLDAGRVLLTHLGADVRAAVPRLLAEAPKNGPRLDFADDGLALEILPKCRKPA